MRKIQTATRPTLAYPSKSLSDLPDDILHLIISTIDIQADISTYASLMRVSSRINQITAPILYQSILVDPMRPSGVLVKSIGYGNKRVSPTKWELLAKVRYIRFLHLCTFPQHKHWSLMWEYALGGVNATTLHVDVGSYRIGDLDGSCACVRRSTGIRELAMSEFRWRTLVVNGQACCSPLQWLGLGSWSNEAQLFCSIVSWKGSKRGQILDWSGPLCQPLSEIMVIFINPKENQQVGSADTTQDNLSYRDTDIGQAGEHIREAVLRGMANRITIVNAGHAGRIAIHRLLQKGVSRESRKKVAYISIGTLIDRRSVNSILTKEDYEALLYSQYMSGSQLEDGDDGELSDTEVEE